MTVLHADRPRVLDRQPCRASLPAILLGVVARWSCRSTSSGASAGCTACSRVALLGPSERRGCGPVPTPAGQPGPRRRRRRGRAPPHRARPARRRPAAAARRRAWTSAGRRPSSTPTPRRPGAASPQAHDGRQGRHRRAARPRPRHLPGDPHRPRPRRRAVGARRPRAGAGRPSRSSSRPAAGGRGEHRLLHRRRGADQRRQARRAPPRRPSGSTREAATGSSSRSRDNGVGGAAARPGGGLAGLADRAARIDGTLTVTARRAAPR